MKNTLFTLTVLLLVAFFAMPAMPNLRSRPLSSTRNIVIDGKAFRQGNPDGVIPRANAVFTDSLMETEGSAPCSRIPIPEGLHSEHSLLMESDSGPVDIAFGTFEAGNSRIRRLLCSSGWEFVEQDQGSISLATIRKGRETTIVLLEEKEGKFLLMRKRE